MRHHSASSDGCWSTKSSSGSRARLTTGSEVQRGMAYQAPKILKRSFPSLAVGILALCSTVNSFTLVNLFPYAGFMVKDLMRLESANEAGYYAGYIASAYTLGRFLTGYAWGLASDKIGRKPVLNAGLLSIMVFSVVFGVSTTFTMAVFSRFLLGLTNGVITASQASMRDVCGQEHVAEGVAYMGGARGVSIVLGAGVGGLLADPVRHYPTMFSATGLFARYPYLLPNLVGAFLALVTMLLVGFCLTETKDIIELSSKYVEATSDKAEVPQEQPQAYDVERSTNRYEYSSTETRSVIGGKGASNIFLQGGASLSDAGRVQKEPTPCGKNGLLSTPTVVVVLFLGCIVQMIIIGFDETFPLWALSAAEVGGLGWDTKRIGQVWVAAGLFVAALQLVWFPRIARVIGIIKLQRAGCLLGVLAFLLFPNANLLNWSKASLFAVCVANTVLVNSAFAAVDIALTVASTSIVPQLQRGQLNGMYSTAASLGRLLGPVGYATTFAYSISPSAREVAFVDYHLVFYASAVAVAGVTSLSFCLLTSESLAQPADQADTLEGGCGGLPDRLSSSTEKKQVSSASIFLKEHYHHSSTLRATYGRG